MKINKGFFRAETQIDHIYKFTNLGGNPDYSTKYSGFVKCKFIYNDKDSLIFPELIVIGEKEFNWIQFYSVCLNFLIKDKDIIHCMMLIDLSFRTNIKIHFQNNDLQKCYPDNSSLFKCEIYGPKDLADYYTGTGYFNDGIPFVKLYHHTKSEIKEIIENTHILKSSKWNFQGTKILNNTNFIYFTCIDKIIVPRDLEQIAMSSEGKILLSIDNFERPQLLLPDFLEKYRGKILEIEVYRESTRNRDSSIEFWVNSTNIYSPNVWLHKSNDSYLYYEICNPFIYRVGVQPNEEINFRNNIISEINLPIQEEMIIGDCTTIKGLEAPYDEENTKEKFKILPHNNKNILELWFEKGFYQIDLQSLINKSAC
jgi:hypothetical protein